ncbi:fimbria/pilus outer membrane usher protein [Pseudomonas azotoformans]|uniref:fimbria/pilus outer membrane usher protein n=1 Tax=Pseudomonas azotoformans TaxID=47878 RepID=UPI0009F3FCFE|nr:fimbria/pilus outer membrane usher protein [Pseudomonas azotoformans]
MKKVDDTGRQHQPSLSLQASISRALGSRVFIGLTALWSVPAHSLALGDGFDLAVLAANGIDPKVADYFRSAARFREGVQVVGLRVNGNSLGLVEARFDYQGQLCFTPGLLEKAGLRVPDAIIRQGVAASQACHDFLGEYPATIVRLRPGSDEVTLVVPTQSMRESDWDLGGFSQGGTAALFNYDVQGFGERSGSDSTRSMSAYTEAGFNLGNWIVRSRQFYVSDNGESRSEHVSAYAQRDFTALNTTFQVGQISSDNPVFGGLQLSGFQFSPDGRSRGAGGDSQVVVEGLASSDSRVDVRQAGVLIYTTLVPAGPFTLTGLPLLNGTSDLEVSVTGTRGGGHSFTVPAASFRGAVQVKTGYYFSVGQARGAKLDSGQAPIVAMGSGTWGLGRDSSLGFGLLSTDAYHAAGGTLSTVFFQRLSVGVRQNLSRDSLGSVRGGRSAISVGSPLKANIETSVSATTQTRGYREVLEAGRSVARGELDARFKNQYTAGVSWFSPHFGGFSLNYSRSSQFDGQSAGHVSTSWNREFSGTHVALIADSRVGGSRPRNTRQTPYEQRSRAPGKERSVRLEVTIPLGENRTVRSYASRREDRVDLGSTFSERVNDSVNYEVGVAREHVTQEQSIQGRVNVTPRYTQFSVGMRRDALGSGYSGQLQGGVVAHERGLTFSPYTVQDTFGIVAVGDVGAAKVSTPQGPVWTDYRGQAVIAGLPAYHNSNVEVQTQSLPRRVDLKNGTKTLKAGRGSFSTVDFEVIKVRRLLLEVRDAHGRLLPQGAPVFGRKNAFLTSVVGDGMVFLNDLNELQALNISLPDTSTCSVQLNAEPEIDEDKYYETASAVCHVL